MICLKSRNDSLNATKNTDFTHDYKYSVSCLDISTEFTGDVFQRNLN